MNAYPAPQAPVLFRIRHTLILRHALPLHPLVKLRIALRSLACALPFWIAFALADCFHMHTLVASQSHTLGDYLRVWALYLCWLPVLSYWLEGFVRSHLYVIQPFNSDAHGTARLATYDDMRAAKLLERGGIFLGLVQKPGKKRKRPEWEMLRYQGDAHLLAVAPTGTGKFRDLLAIAIMTYQNSMVIIDPKGQAASVCARGLRERGFNVDIVNPFNLYPERLGPSATYNVMDNLDPGSLSFGADCAAITDALMIRPANEGNSKHFNDRAASAISGVERHLAKAAPPELRNLAALRSIIASDTALMSFCDEACACGDQLTIDMLNGFRTPPHKPDNPPTHYESREVQDVLSTARAQLDFLGNEAINASVKASSVRFSKCRTRRTAIFIVLPTRYLESCGKWFRLLIAGALHELLREQADNTIPVLMILDEFMQLGRLAAIDNALGIARGYKLQLWPILQELTRLPELYGQGWQSFVSAAGVRQFFAPREAFTAKHISELAGQTTVATSTKSFGQVAVDQWKLGFTGETDSAAHTARPLFFPDEVMRLADWEQLLFVHNMHVTRAARAPYFAKLTGSYRLEGRPLASYFDPDPQHLH